jgi:hypothetical protein
MLTLRDSCLGTSNPDTPYLPKQSGDNKCDTIRADIYLCVAKGFLNNRTN